MRVHASVQCQHTLLARDSSLLRVLLGRDCVHWRCSMQTCGHADVHVQDTPTMLGASGSAAERKRKRAADIASKQRVAKKKLFKAAAGMKQE